MQSEVDDNDSDQFEDEEENEDDINIEDEDFSQFGVPVGEDALRKFNLARALDRHQPRRHMSNKTQSSTRKQKYNEVDPFRPRTPSLKNSFRKSTPIEGAKRKGYNQSQVGNINFDKRSEPLTHTHNTMNLNDDQLGDTMSNDLNLN